jgi:hypothetical protein
LGRIAAMVAALAIGLLLLAARGAAGAGLYTVVQCGSGAGVDATWDGRAPADSTVGSEFRADSACTGAGAHVGSATVGWAAGIGGGQSAVWRWAAPAGTGIVEVSGYWWHSLGSGFEERLGTDAGGADPSPFAAAATTALAPAPFSAAFTAPRAGFEDELWCARAPSAECSLSPPSWSALGPLELRIADPAPPRVALAGDLLAGGWRRGVENAAVSGTDVGSGLRTAEVRIDGQAAAQAELPCAKAELAGPVGTKMQPCQLEATAGLAVATAAVGDGSHSVVACVADFAENVACTPDQSVLIDNTAPASPLGLRVTAAKGGGSREFDLAWADPDQGQGSPVASALWRVSGPAGYDTGVKVTRGRGIAALAGVSVPRDGDYLLHLWLGDEAGNASAANAVTVPLRDGARASGPAPGGGGSKRHRGGPRRRGGESADPGAARTRVRLMVHLRAAGPGDRGDRSRARAARSEWPGIRARREDRRASGRDRGGSLTVPFGAGASVAGRLTGADGSGIAGRRIHVVARPWRGADAPATRATVRTGRRGGFELALAPGPSRRVAVAFAGGAGLAPVRRDGLDLRVRSGVTLSAAPAALETGQEVHLSGRVSRRGAPIPGPGKLVAIQYLEAATHRWRPALVVRSDGRGRFDTGYRFRYISGTARIRLRATALAEDGWPYAPGSSPPVTVAVHGG